MLKKPGTNNYDRKCCQWTLVEEDQIEKSTGPYNYSDRIIRRDYNNVLEKKKACLSWLQSCTTDKSN